MCVFLADKFEKLVKRLTQAQALGVDKTLLEGTAVSLLLALATQHCAISTIAVCKKILTLVLKISSPEIQQAMVAAVGNTAYRQVRHTSPCP